MSKKIIVTGVLLIVLGIILGAFGAHALKNAMIPIITIYGMSLPFLLGGSVLIESIFSWPGMGSLAIEAVQNRDYPLILATTMMGAILVVFGNLLADITYAIVDPRVSYDK